MVKFATNVSGAILLPSSIQVMESISGSVLPLAMFVIIKISRRASPQASPVLFCYYCGGEQVVKFLQSAI